MTNHEFSPKHLLSAVLCRHLSPVEAPTALSRAPLPSKGRVKVVAAKLAWAAGLLILITAGFGTHFYAQQAYVSTSASTNLNQAAIKPVQMHGACHLCHSGEYL